MRLINKLLILFLIFSITSCRINVVPSSTPIQSEPPVEGQAREGQPPFPSLDQYWIVDKGCNFDLDKVKIADITFEKLRADGIAEVALVCQTDILDKGATNDEKIWLRDWGRWAKMGDKEDNRSLVWLIRPDIKSKEGRISLEASRWMTWYTAVDYMEAINEAANYANANDFNGALISIARNVDAKLRELWKTHQP